MAIQNLQNLLALNFQKGHVSGDLFSTYIQGIIDTYGGVMLPFQETSGSYPQAYNTALAEGRDIVINGGFDADSDWTKGTGWSIAAGVASAAAATTTNLEQTVAISLNRTYEVSFEIVSIVSGAIRVQLYDATSVDFNTTGIKTVDLTPTAIGGGTIMLDPRSSFEGSIDNVTLKLKNILASSGYPSAELLTDGDMEAADTSAWTVISGAVLSKQTTNPYAGSKVLRIFASSGDSSAGAGQTIMTVGKKYRIKAKARGDGANGTVRIYTSAGGAIFLGTTSTTWQDIDFEIIAPATQIQLYCSGNSATEDYTEWDDVSVTEVNPLNGTTSGATVGQTANSKLKLGYSFDGTNDYVNWYSNTFNSFFNPSAGTLLCFAKVSGAGVWTDGNIRLGVNLYSDDNNRVRIFKSSDNNTLVAGYQAGGTDKSVNVSFSGAGVFMIAITWDNTADQVKVFLNGSQSGSTGTSLGAWVGNLLSSRTIVGAYSTAPNYVWSGLIAYPMLFRQALTPTVIAEIASKAGVA